MGRAKTIKTGDDCRAAFPDCANADLAMTTQIQYGAYVSKRQNKLDVDRTAQLVRCRFCRRTCTFAALDAANQEPETKPLRASVLADIIKD